MHAYLVSGYQPETVKEAVDDLTRKLKVKKLGFEIKKIADAHELSRFVNLALNEKTAIVVEKIDEASVQAQNAFLKNLEEPQENLIYILTAKNQASVLPTIASRCQIIETRNSETEIPKEKRQMIKDFLNASIGKKLGITAKINRRDEAIQFIKDVLVLQHTAFKDDPKLLHSIELTSSTLMNLERNGNIQIQLTNFVINSSR